MTTHLSADAALAKELSLSAGRLLLDLRADFGPVDRILGNIIGSAFTHSYDTDPMTGDIIFIRHEDTSHRHYVSPDQRQIIIIDEAANIQPESWPNPEKSE